MLYLLCIKDGCQSLQLTKIRQQFNLRVKIQAKCNWTRSEQSLNAQNVTKNFLQNRISFYILGFILANDLMSAKNAETSLKAISTLNHIR